jgi:hypothetical protein
MALVCQPYAAVALYPQKYFLVRVSVKGRVNSRAIVRLERSGKLKQFNDLIETRARDLPACSIAPQPFTLSSQSNITSYYHSPVSRYVASSLIWHLLGY